MVNRRRWKGIAGARTTGTPVGSARGSGSTSGKDAEDEEAWPPSSRRRRVLGGWEAIVCVRNGHASMGLRIARA